MNYSVALCTYNGQDFIAEQLESIFRQTMPPRQIVVCDDRSDDDTVDIIRKISKEQPQIDWKIIVNEQNLGVVRNFEKAIGLCDHEWVFLSDQDDVWLPEKAEKIFAFSQKKNKSVVFSDAMLVDEKLESLGKTMFENINFNETDQRLFYKKNIGRSLLLRKYHVTGATLAFNKKVVDNFLPVPDNSYFIHDGWIGTLGICNGQLGFIDKPLILYRQHDKQAIGGKIGLNLKEKDRLFWEEKRGLKSNASRVDRLMASLKYYQKKEKTIFDFSKKHASVFNDESIKFLRMREKLFNEVCNRPTSFMGRIARLSLNLYFLRIPNFHTLRAFLGNSYNYIFK